MGWTFLLKGDWMGGWEFLVCEAAPLESGLLPIRHRIRSCYYPAEYCYGRRCVGEERKVLGEAVYCQIGELVLSCYCERYLGSWLW